MLNDPVKTLLAVLPASLIGGAVMIACAYLGWRVTWSRRGWLIRCTSCWFDRVVRPLLSSRSWARRAAIIAVNNSLVCAGLVVLGSLGRVAWLGIAAAGLGLGAALRLIMELSETDATGTKLGRWQRVLAGVGITLNLLEPPAILLTIGLSLTQGAIAETLDWGLALGLYGRFVLPMLLAAAAGEALWLTVCGVRSGPPPPASDELPAV